MGSAQAAPSASSRPAADPFADLTGPSSSSAPAGWPTTKVFEKEGIVVSFDFSKPPGRPPVTDITATYTNTGLSHVTDFTLQVGTLLCSLCAHVPPGVSAVVQLSCQVSASSHPPYT